MNPRLENRGNGNQPQPRRRHARTEVVNLHIERPENIHIHLHIGDGVGFTKLFESVLSAVESLTPSAGMIASQSGRLAKLEEVVRSNGHGK